MYVLPRDLQLRVVHLYFVIGERAQSSLVNGRVIGYGHGKNLDESLLTHELQVVLLIKIHLLIDSNISI